MADSQKAVESVVFPAAPTRPEEYDTATRAVLDHIDRQAIRTVSDGRPERTRSGYAQDWASWTKFCAASEVPVLAVTAGTLVMFVEWLWTQPGWKKGTCTAPSTIDRRLSGTVVSARAEHGVRLEEGIARLARNRLKQLVKEMEASGETRGRGQAPPLLVDHLARISAACPDNLMGIRDRALVLMHFAVAGREHELSFNRVRDYAETPAGIQADLRVSKVRPRIVPVPYGSRPSVCPVRTWQAWKDAAALDDPDSPAWLRLHSRRHTVQEGGLSPEGIGDVITRAGERAGIEIRFTGHSPRRGLATSSRLKGHDQIVIAKQGGWAPHSKVLAGYLEVVDQWEDNALLGVL
ncbi:integrase [Streptomyces sp. Sge12]|uniref:integrase n=1 Tax=Streptomyces sp. Sge12 TaxID=1972846 RepID=UPI000D1B7A61|nr:integrase [Streptomyces sp. Sge12]